MRLGSLVALVYCLNDLKADELAKTEVTRVTTRVMSNKQRTPGERYLRRLWSLFLVLVLRISSAN